MKGVVVDTTDAYTVVVDGETRRRKVNVRHLEPLEQTIDVKKGASHDEVAAALQKAGIAVRKTKPKNAGERPRKVRKVKVKPMPKQKVVPAKKETETPSESPKEDVKEAAQQ
jgi:large subunit ribosomal protein L14e